MRVCKSFLACGQNYFAHGAVRVAKRKAAALKVLNDDSIPAHVVGVKREILEAALNQFILRGSRGITVADVAKEAGISRQRILYHYPEVDDMLMELSSFWGERGRMVTLEYLARLTSASAEDRIVGIGESMFLWMQKYPRLASLTPVLLQARYENTHIRSVFDAAMAAGRDRIEDLLKIASPHTKTSHFTEVAGGIHGLLMGVGLFIVTHKEWKKVPTMREMTSLSIRTIIRKSGI
jgi:AcrR family transcriptional regulator